MTPAVVSSSFFEYSMQNPRNHIPQILKLCFDLFNLNFHLVQLYPLSDNVAFKIIILVIPQSNSDEVEVERLHRATSQFFLIYMLKQNRFATHIRFGRARGIT